MNRWLIIIILAAPLIGGGYFYFTTTQEQLQQYSANIATLEANQQTLTAANEQTIATMNSLQQAYQQIEEDFSKLEDEFQKIREQNNILSEKLEDNDLGQLAALRPELIESIINRASDNAMRCFELLSGSPLTEDEKNAKSAREFNSECPWLWPNSP
jgi:Tfp pilus assembly protein PilO